MGCLAYEQEIRSGEYNFNQALYVFLTQVEKFEPEEKPKGFHVKFVDATPLKTKTELIKERADQIRQQEADQITSFLVDTDKKN